MKLYHLLEEYSEHEVREWFRKHCMSHDDRIYFENGKLYFQEDVSLTLDCEEIPYKVENVVKQVEVGYREYQYLTSVKNIPEAKVDISLGGQHLEIIDHPLIAGGRVNLAMNRLRTVKNIHKYVKCEEITIWNNPIKSGLLDLLRIPGIKIVDSGKNGVLIDGFEDSHQALEIISKYADKGKAGIIQAQQELIDNDLEDYE